MDVHSSSQVQYNDPKIRMISANYLLQRTPNISIMYQVGVLWVLIELVLILASVSTLVSRLALLMSYTYVLYLCCVPMSCTYVL